MFIEITVGPFEEEKRSTSKTKTIEYIKWKFISTTTTKYVATPTINYGHVGFIEVDIKSVNNLRLSL
jgi:hypothetical protein